MKYFFFYLALGTAMVCSVLKVNPDAAIFLAAALIIGAINEKS